MLTYNGSTWSAPAKIDTNGYLNSVSCPSSSFCAAGDDEGNGLTYNGGTWSTPASIDPGTAHYLSMSCPTASFCAAVDAAGNGLTYNGSTWSDPASIDPGGDLTSVSCPTASFCAAVDRSGNVLTYNGSTWSAPQSIDPGGQGLVSVSCASASFCVAVDNTGDALTYTGSGIVLSVAESGSGSGMVTSSPAGIDCGLACSAQFAQGSDVTLTAVAGSGSVFAGWSGGGCSGTQSTCVVSMASAESVTATFNARSGGVAAEPGVSLNATALIFGSSANPVPVGATADQQLRVTNDGQAALVVGTLAISGPQASAFSLSADGCSRVTLFPGFSCVVTVSFTPGGSASPFAATITVPDNAPNSPQTVALSGAANLPAGEGYVVGTVVDANQQPVAGATVSACEVTSSGFSFSSCRTVFTTTIGRYTMLLPAGTWVVEAYPNAPGPAAVSARDVLSADSGVIQNFTLAAPTPLSDGFSVDGQTSGTPIFFYTSPFTFRVPLPIPRSSTPNTTRLFVGFAGIDAGAQSADPANQLIQATAILISAHYGPDGHVDAVSDPILAPVDCSSSKAAATSCAPLVQSIAGAPGSGSAAQPPCPPPAPPRSGTPAISLVKGWTIKANHLGGIDITMTEHDGSTHTFVLAQAQIPTLSGDHPWANAGIDVFNAGLNMLPAVGEYNTGVGVLNGVTSTVQSVRAHDGNTAENFDGLGWTVVSQLYGGDFHGPLNFFWNLTSGAVSQALTPSGPNTIQVSGCNAGSASGYADPSGTVHTASGVPIEGATVTLLHRAGGGRGLSRVPNGSVIMSPANRRNPTRTNALGQYGWDVLPGSYQITASHRGCTAAHHRVTAVSRLLGVPPAQTGVDLVLSCPRLRRGAVKLKLAVVEPRKGSAKLASVGLAVTLTGHRHDRPQGTVTFVAGRRRLATVPVIDGTARYWLPAAVRVKGVLRAVYSGDAGYTPAVVSRQLPVRG